MLILSRKVDEQIVIGDDILITIVGISRGNVRLGLEVPKEMPVHRREIYDAIQQGKLNVQGLEAAAQQSATAEITESTSYEQFRTQLDKGKYAEAGKLYFVSERKFEASRDELERLSGGLYRLI